MKKCGVCKSLLKLTDFSQNRSNKDGLRVECKRCMSEYKSRYRRNNKSKLNAYARKYSKLHKRAINHKTNAIAQRKFRQKYPEIIRANSALRRARMLKAVPTWLKKEDLQLISSFYRNCPPGYHVDHIEPLAGNSSCGLHVIWNLQYLPMHDNLSKGNRI